MLVAHDISAEMAWIFAHRFSPLIRKLVIINGTHPRTHVRAIVRCQDWQTFRLPWVPFFEIPGLPEAVLTTGPGRKFLRWDIIVREARKGAIDRPLVDELVARFQHPRDGSTPLSAPAASGGGAGVLSGGCGGVYEVDVGQDLAGVVDAETTG